MCLLWDDSQASQVDSLYCMASSEQINGCHAQQDGDCTWKECPQLRDGEPKKSGRRCPLDIDDEVRSQDSSVTGSAVR